MPTQDSDQTVLWIELRTVDNKTSHLLRGDKRELNYTTIQFWPNKLLLIALLTRSAQ